MSSTYVYQITGEGSDFTSGKVSATTLSAEIRANVNIHAILDFINTDLGNNSCSLYFLSELNTDEKSALDNVIANHQGIDVYIPESISQQTILEKTYSEFIAICLSKAMLMQSDRQTMETSLGYGYYLFAFDSNIKYHCILFLENDILDYEAKYLSISNKPLDMREAGTGILKVKPRLVEGTLYYMFTYFQLNNTVIDCNTDTDWRVIVADIPNTNLAMTKIILSPKYNYYIAGGYITSLNDIIDKSIMLQVIGAPSIPSAYGGNMMMVNNKKFLIPNEKVVVSAPPKYMKYYQANPAANELEYRFTHSKETNAYFEIGTEIYKA